ncbi:MAG: helix-turn-helix domain-containing protein, partial [Actinobacteria bacterium]|nr:helix-turn-helix domain-containing protein [Actinomycetota bacterium]
MMLDPDTCYRAVLARDPRFDGRFFTAVTSTGIYCRPICPARTPARRNMRFFPHAAAAEAAGFRACRRCRPEASPGSPEWNARGDLVARAVRLIGDGCVDEHGVGGLARRLAVTDRHLRRLMLAELGTTPLALARTTRLQTARRLLAETGMPVTEIAFASGFTSIRQFNASFQQACRQSPSAVRAAAPGQRPRGAGHRNDGTWLSLRLACREPFDGQALLRFLAARAIPGVEEVTGNRYARTVHTPAGPGLIELAIPPEPGQVLLRARLSGLRGVGQVVSRCRRLLDLDADPQAIGAALAADEVLAPLVAARPGLRVPGAYDGFELAVRAVLGQQVSLAAARTFAARLAARFGSHLDPGAGPAAGVPHLLFPRASDLAGADLSGLGLTAARQLTLRALAGAVASGRLSIGPGADPGETAARLAELPGIGPWTISYVLMRAVADPDAYPAGDLGLRRALAGLGCGGDRAGRWRPWRAYAAMHLWAADPAELPPMPGTATPDSP